MNKVWVFSGGRLGEWATELPDPEDMTIGADRGALFLVRHGFRPEVAVGDFDSVTPEELEEIKSGCGRLVECDPIRKDCSDTELAFQAALQFQPTEIVLVGALGTRFDHSLANVHLLVKALEQGVPCRVIDEYNEIRLTDGQLDVFDSSRQYKYISLLPLTMEVTGITLEGFRYPLSDAVLKLGQSLAISNELIGARGHIRLRSGLLLVIQSRD